MEVNIELWEELEYVSEHALSVFRPCIILILRKIKTFIKMTDL